MTNDLVSIIIPTYNRAEYLLETLGSVLVQTYSNWECIIVDDGSTDETENMVLAYIKQDSRFIYKKRPVNKPKGANSCRNYGFKLSNGKFVNWFDDDDLMMPNFIANKVSKIVDSNVGFLFSKTNNFYLDGKEEPIFAIDNNAYEINATNFIIQKIVWCTLDFMSKRTFLNDIKFNETLKSGQEYNFFSKFLQQDVTGVFLDKVLAKRRIHDNSIQQKQTKDFQLYTLNKYLVYFVTLIEIKNKSSKLAINHLLSLSMSKAFDLSVLNKKVPYIFNLIWSVFKNKPLLKFLVFLLALFSGYLLGKGFFLLKYSKNNY